MHLFLQLVAWSIAIAWVSRSFEAHRGLPRVPNLLLPEHDLNPAGEPSLTVIVPARNEAAGIQDCLQSLLMQDYPALNVIAVNDRSTDTTGEIMKELSLLQPAKLQVIQIEELPPEWLGKTHAMAIAAHHTDAEFLLFTDADIVFAPSALRRALAYAVTANADHLVLMPTTIIHRWDEAGLLSFFQILGFWAIRPWRVSDPASRRDALGIGAFNLIRRSAYDAVGGFEALRMEIVEDLGMGRRIKRAGLRQRVAFGRGLVSVHWAPGVPGLVNVMTKNIFAAVNFRVPLLLLGCLWLIAFCILPFALVWVSGFTAPALAVVVAMAWVYILLAKISGLSPWNVLLAPFAAALFVFTLLRSMVKTLRQGGVIWRGTFYALETLRRHMASLR